MTNQDGIVFTAARAAPRRTPTGRVERERVDERERRHVGQAGRGLTLGFLAPNGAGNTTMMFALLFRCAMD